MVGLSFYTYFRFMKNKKKDETDFDIFIIGGGVNGAGILRDAAGRGFKCGLAEMGDFGSATSSSTHGYLAGGQPSIVNIQKFIFASDTNGTDVGDLPFARRQNAGTHY